MLELVSRFWMLFQSFIKLRNRTFLGSEKQSQDCRSDNGCRTETAIVIDKIYAIILK